MSVFKTTFSRALPVIKSDTANIPYPNVIASGVATGTDLDKLIDSAATFITNNVQTGDIVYSLTSLTAATVVEVIDENTLLLNADIISASQEYVVYQASSQTGLGNPGCYLYIAEGVVGAGARVTVTTIGGDIVTFFGIVSGTTLPIQVIKLHATETNVEKTIALW